jgi:hypothetical protein
VSVSRKIVCATRTNARRRIAELEARILQLEEEVLIEQALVAGVDCHRRPYAPPWPLLGIEPDTAAG